MARQNPVVFAVQYNDDKCKKYAIDVLGIFGIVAENDQRSGQLQRNVNVYETEGSTNLDRAEKILKIFGNPVQKVVRRSVFKVTLNSNTTSGEAIRGVGAIVGVLKVDEKAVEQRNKGTSFTKYDNPPVTLEVTGNVDPETILRTLRQYGTAHIV